MNKGRLTLGVVAVAVWSLQCQTANADGPALWSGNGHYYEYSVLPQGVAGTWDNVMSAAGTSTYLGVQGHLATLTSQAENDFAYGLLPTDSNQYISESKEAWVGGYKAADNTWNWVTGEAWTFTKWASGEPSGLSYEKYLALVGPPAGPVYAGKWIDIGFQPIGAVVGYVVEYPVPEPATLSLLALGGLALIRRRRK